MFHREDAIYTIKYIIECHILSTNKYIRRTIQDVSEIIEQAVGWRYYMQKSVVKEE